VDVRFLSVAHLFLLLHSVWPNMIIDWLLLEDTLENYVSCRTEHYSGPLRN